ncbi:baseplate J/gp47 family protein [Pseudoalteromonas sp. SCSIO 43201]|uniref:baseplate assembly protein n=1 Tax=Pseudoalteromonas sp. SCSIO 43201 TaxID=2822842 RepID=UPI00207553FE|nr:baseplate J/gp47 family protein [Pseudoalteromonas sp. SCSIO 43201]USD29475.1 baseplate J/gp47 family protein [Pseudoalteromonas sp. SCSIO 43201]
MASSKLIDLSALPLPQLLDNLEYEHLVEQLKSTLSEQNPDISAVLKLESEPLTQLLNTFAYHSMLLQGRINDAVKGNLLAAATSTDLDHIAVRYGVSRLPQEPDDRFRSRIQQSFHSLNTAGTAESYRYHALSADSRVKDVHVASPSPCHVVLTILSHESPNGLPSDGLLNKLKATFGLKADTVDTVSDVLALQKVRPIGDRVEIKPVTVKPYTLHAQVQLAPGPGKAQVKAQVLAKLRDFFAQTGVMGKAIKRSALFATLYSSGVEDVVLAAPSENVTVEGHEIPWCENDIAGVIFEGDV